MKPDILIGREKPCQLGADDANDVAQHGNEDQTTIEGEDEASTTRGPDRQSEGIEGSKPLV
jgi:hypothetical protein